MFKGKYVLIAGAEYYNHGIITDEDQRGMVLVKLDCPRCSHPSGKQVLVDTNF